MLGSLKSVYKNNLLIKLVFYLIIALFMLSLTYKFVFITIDLSTATELHTYNIYLIEFFCGCIWIYLLYNNIFKYKKRTIQENIVFVGIITFAIYYVMLTLFRIVSGGIYSESLDLFRNIFFLLTIIVLVLSENFTSTFLFKILLYYFSALSVGFYHSVYIQKTFGAFFPDNVFTYITLSFFMLPIFVFCIHRRKEFSVKIIEIALIWIDILCINIACVLSGSRLSIVFIIFVWVCILIIFLKEKYTLSFICRSLAISIILIGVLYYGNIYYCRSGIVRVANADSYTKYFQSSVSREKISDEITKTMDERNKAIITDSGTSAGVKNDILLNNPTSISNDIRKYVQVLAIEELKGDWLFNKNGKTAFQYNFFGQIETSGAHNLILDYMLAFGLIGTCILIFIFLVPLICVYKFTIKNKNKIVILGCFLLCLIPTFAIAMFQATFCNITPLAILFIVIGFWYNLKNNGFECLKALRICMLVTTGVINDSRILREAKIAAENGFDVQIIGRKIPELGEVDRSLPFDIKLIPIDRATKSKILGKIIERVRIGFAFTTEAIKYRPDIIHANDFDTLPFGYLAARVCDSKLVYDSHELWSENELVAHSKTGKKIVKCVEGFLVHQCDKVISVSNASGAWLRQTYKLNNLIVITNCPYLYNGDMMEKNSKFELLCHGMFAENRGFEELINCASLVEKEGISVAIRGYGEKTEYFKNLALRTGQKNIVILSKVPSFEVVKAASASHVGVILTRPISISYELTVSNKLFECVNAGLPVILSDVPEHRFLNEKYKFGIILKEISAECLAEAAIKLKNDVKLYETLKQNSISAARELCWEIEGLKLISVYKDILNEERYEYETNIIKKGNYINI